MTEERQAAIRELVDTRGGKVVNEESDAAILEFTGDKEELEEILTRLEALGMEDFARTGVIALETGQALNMKPSLARIAAREADRSTSMPAHHRIRH